MSIETLAALPFVFLFGITVGSFLNVCIYRIPKGEDLVHTNSHCMSCGYHLQWFDLIPVLSWLVLRGRCRKCGEKISIQYPLIELANGLIWTALTAAHGFGIPAACLCIASSALLVLSVIDWRTYEIPFGCNLVILAAGIVNLIADPAHWAGYLIGMISVSLVLYLIVVLSKGRAMGGGDVKLMFAAGLLLGWQNTILAFCLGCILASVIHIARMKLSGEDHVLAFGPYLSLGIWISMMWGQPMIHWYLQTILQ
jgi:leader peptidase (prepilin peptidase)/N-methyltransferase